MPGQPHQQDVDGSNKLSAEDLSSVLTSEAFYLNCFKILPCSKRYAHEWTTCPFAHPGEKAKRRDPRCYNYDCEMCPAVVKGEVCELGQACPHSHHVFESWLHPQKFRTMLCKDGDSCHREVCFFAHGAEQLRVPSRDTPSMPCFAGPSRLRRSGSGPPGSGPPGTRDHHQQQQQQLAAGLQALQLGGFSAILLTTLMEEVQTSKQEAMQNKNAADVAQEQLRLLMATLSGSPSGTEPNGLTTEQAAAACSNGMVALLNAAANNLPNAGGNGAFPGLVLQEGGVPSGMAFSGHCVLPSALGSSAQVLDMQTTGTALSMPLPVGTTWMRLSSLEAPAPAVGPPGVSGFNSCRWPKVAPLWRVPLQTCNRLLEMLVTVEAEAWVPWGVWGCRAHQWSQEVQARLLEESCKQFLKVVLPI
eukprot:gene10639-10797_t